MQDPVDPATRLHKKNEEIKSLGNSGDCEVGKCQ
jgi:hypothetical protein